MVAGLPKFESPLDIFKECFVNKQHRDAFPKGKSQRARKILKHVHSKLCGSIKPMSNGSKWYFILNTNDFI